MLDMDYWVHEGFANYSESLFVEYHFSKKEAEDYMIGNRRLIKNDRPIIGTYGANREGSGDMYPKGGNMLHTIRHVIDDDTKWLSILRGLNADFWHQTVSTQKVNGKTLSFSYERVVKGFAMRIRVSINGKQVVITPTETVQSFVFPEQIKTFEVNRNFYINAEKTDP